MFNLGAGEVVVILLVALIVLGPTRLPEAARTVGRVMGELRRLSSGFQNEVRDAFQDVDAPSPLDRRRTESKPLAATVEEADRGVAGATPSHAIAPDSPRRGASAGAAAPASANGSANGDGNAGPAAGAADGEGDHVTAEQVTAGGPTEVVERGEVSPEVGEALDQISAAFPASARPAPAPAPAPADDEPQAP